MLNICRYGEAWHHAAAFCQGAAAADRCDDKTDSDTTTYNNLSYLPVPPLVSSIPCPPSDRCDTTGVPDFPPRQSSPPIKRFCPTLGWFHLVKSVTHRVVVSVTFVQTIVLIKCTWHVEQGRGQSFDVNNREYDTTEWLQSLVIIQWYCIGIISGIRLHQRWIRSCHNTDETVTWPMFFWHNWHGVFWVYLLEEYRDHRSSPFCVYLMTTEIDLPNLYPPPDPVPMKLVHTCTQVHWLSQTPPVSCLNPPWD